ncbi:epoxide hydrolase family protein [Amycolatopsis nigrescens]|uniref:epoxide hydrolase family protein n=1 Tax=Amycolatopsis nigrescens TaxID=381445 RepID=UPI000365098E|nr:epoxide hydrolase family protein [Amycolatopsis nigrescens]
MIEPFRAHVGQAEIDDLRRRLAATRWPEPETVDDWSQGVPLGYVRELCRYWADGYDFGFADRVNAFPQFRTELDGLGIHFLHVRSPEPDALPLLLTHGWPGSVVEFLKVLGPLTDPGAHGGDPADAFHVVAPSLPGFGWSDKPSAPGWDTPRIARAFAELMTRLGYSRYGAQGGDWGAIVTTALASQHPESLAGIHLNMAMVGLDDTTFDDPTPTERKALADLDHHRTTGSGYYQQQRTRPQTLGYGLTDSPAGQCAWIAEKFWAWTDHDGRPESALTRDEMLDDISVYWFTASAASSARLYWETNTRDAAEISVPSGISIYPKETIRPSRRWAERRFTDLRWHEELDRGGHFAAFEQPGSFVEQLRGFFRLVR